MARGHPAYGPRPPGLWPAATRQLKLPGYELPGYELPGYELPGYM